MKPQYMAFTALLITAALLAASCTPPVATTPAQPASANRQPVIQSLFGATDWEPQAEGDFTCTASDPDGDKLSYAWSADNGTIKGSGASAVWTSPAYMGKYRISVVVSDGRGGEARATQEARVLINADGSMTPQDAAVLRLPFPSAETVNISQKTRIWTASPIQCIVEGQGLGELKYAWTAASGRFQAARGMNLEAGTASRVNWIAPGAGGDYTVNVTVTDGSGNQAKGQVNYKVICCTTE